MNFTYNNHLTYSIGDRKFGYRENSYEKFIVNVGKIDKDHYKKSNYRNELRRTADHVYSNLGKDFALFLSGGTDSEIVARNFIEIGIKPKCFTIKFKNDYNINDVIVAQQLAKNLDIPLTILEFDIKEFINSGEALEFSKTLQCTQITYLLIYYNILKVNLPSVMGGELLLTRNTMPASSYWYYTLRENEDCSAMRFSFKYNLPLINEWFSYTPELMLYYLEHSLIKKLVTNKFNYKLTSVSSKNEILKTLIPEIEIRTKTHGFEQLLGYNFESYRNFSKDQIQRLESSLDGIEYNDIIKRLT